MNDGQRQVFFTAGDGLKSPYAKSDNPDDVNLENWVGNSQQGGLPGEDTTVFQGQAIFSGARGAPEKMPVSMDFSRDIGEIAWNAFPDQTDQPEARQNPALGAVMPEGFVAPASPAASATPAVSAIPIGADTSAVPMNFRQESILTEGDKLSSAAFTEVRKLEGKLNHDGDIASFYDDIRDAAKVNLEHSFGRKVGQ